MVLFGADKGRADNLPMLESGATSAALAIEAHLSASDPALDIDIILFFIVRQKPVEAQPDGFFFDGKVLDFQGNFSRLTTFAYCFCLLRLARLIEALEEHKTQKPEH